MSEALPTARIRIGPAHREGYLRVIASSGAHSVACKSVGVSRNSMRAHIEAHPDFAEQVEDARQQFADSLLAEAKRRAVDGLAGELVLYEGEPVADPERPGEFLRKPHRHSDRLLALMLEKVGPEAFRAPDRVVHEHRHSGTVTHTIAPEVLAAMHPSARIEAQRVVLIQDMRDKPDSEKQSALLALAQEASRLGVEFDTLGTARALRIGKLAEPIDADYVEVPSEDIARQLREIEELL